MILELTKLYTIPGQYGSKLCCSHIKLLNDEGKYLRFISAEEALPFIEKYSFQIPDIEKYKI